MPLAEIVLSDFRNHRSTRLDGLARFNLLVGDNGAGKTNVLEALSLLAPGRGLRRAPLAEMAANAGRGNFAVGAKMLTGDVALGTGTLAARPNRRVTRINGAEHSTTALSEWLAIQWLTPAMDRLFTDGAGTRRRFLDRLVLAVEPNHAGHATRYEAALRERNRLLSAERMPEARWFEAVEAQLARHGAELADARARLVARLDDALAAEPDGPFARPRLALAEGVPISAEELARRLAANRAQDRAAGRTLTGPHRDDLLVTLAAKDLPAAQGSTGEQKALLIAILLAHLDLALRERPGLLLLDEVAAHLDPRRRAALFERLAASGAQVWLTGTEAAPFDAIGTDLARWRVADGQVRREL